MKSRIISIVAVALFSGMLAACGSDNDSAIPEEPLSQQPIEQSIEQPIVQEVPIEQEQSNDQTEPQEEPDVVAAFVPAVPGQTAWSLEGQIETRNPLELLKTAVCLGRSELEQVAWPASSEGCSIAFPGMRSDGDLKDYLYVYYPYEDVREHEGCKYVIDSQTLVCSFEYTKEDSEAYMGLAKYWLRAEFIPSFSTAIAECGVGKDHWVGNYNLGTTGSNRAVKTPIAPPLGCIGWDGLKDTFLLHGGVELETDKQPLGCRVGYGSSATRPATKSC